MVILMYLIMGRNNGTLNNPNGTHSAEVEQKKRLESQAVDKCLQAHLKVCLSRSNDHVRCEKQKIGDKSGDRLGAASDVRPSIVTTRPISHNTAVLRAAALQILGRTFLDVHESQA